MLRQYIQTRDFKLAGAFGAPLLGPTALVLGAGGVLEEEHLSRGPRKATHSTPKHVILDVSGIMAAPYIKVQHLYTALSL